MGGHEGRAPMGNRNRGGGRLRALRRGNTSQIQQKPIVDTGAWLEAHRVRQGLANSDRIAATQHANDTTLAQVAMRPGR